MEFIHGQVSHVYRISASLKAALTEVIRITFAAAIVGYHIFRYLSGSYGTMLVADAVDQVAMVHLRLHV